MCLPTLVTGLDPTVKIVKVWCGGQCSYVRDEHASLWVFGCNTSGELALPSLLNVLTPVENLDLHAMQIVPGFSHAFGIRPNGDVFSWGYNLDGQLSRSTVEPRCPIVTKVKELARISRVKSATSRS
jgi:alpha-tubulin suppressor-like RCC1 family protein